MQKIKPIFEIRIRLCSFNHSALEVCKTQWKSLALKYKLAFSSINLPIVKKKFTVLKSPHVNKRAKDQYEIRISRCVLTLRGVDSCLSFVSLPDEFQLVGSEEVSTRLIFSKENV